MVDAGPATDGMAGILAFRPPRRRPYRWDAVRKLRWDAVRKLRRADAAWGDQQPGQLSRRDTAKGLATAATRQLQGDIPPSSRRLGALLS
jgi:hypothetical protein